MTEATSSDLPDQAARDLVTGVDPRGLQRTLFVDAGAGSGKTHSLIGRIVRLVADGHASMSSIAAITFTEKAATELRDRLRIEFDRRVRDPETPSEVIDRLRVAQDELDGAPVSTLHAFAQRLLTEMPLEAGLPPNIEVLDEVASSLEFEDRWTAFRDELLDDEEMARTIRLATAVGVGLDQVRLLAREFDRNWDLASDPERIPDVPPPPALSVDDLIAAADGFVGLSVNCTDDTDKLYEYMNDTIAPWRDRLEAVAGDETGLLRVLEAETLKFSFGQKGNWPDDGKKEALEVLGELRRDRDELVRTLKVAVVAHLAMAAREFVVDVAKARAAAGRLEFHDLLVLARRLLAESEADVRAVLQDRYQRLLLDEFQDTDPLQIEIAVQLAAATDDAGEKPWAEVPVHDGRLFFVGDPKQSIYRFRRADIGLYLDASERFAGDEPVTLTTNFRSTAPIIDWVNHVFGGLIQYAKDSQPDYVPLDAHRSVAADDPGPTVTVLGAEEVEDGVRADDLRDREAAAVADTIVTALTEGWQVQDLDNGAWRPARLGDITVLLPARTSLPMLERALERRGIPYRAEASSLVYATSEVRAVLLALRAVADPSNGLALVAALRSVVFGCGDDDLFRFRQAGGTFNVRAPLPDDLPSDDPVVDAITFLRDLHDQAPWTAPSQLLDRLCRRQRLFELGHVVGHPRDLWRRLRFVIDQARAWSDTEGGTLGEYLQWAKLQASESTQAAEVILPETDHDAVRIMTIHASKGLQFPITILSGTTTGIRRPGAGVTVTWRAEGEAGIKVGGKVKTPAYEEFEPIDEQMDHHERIRLLYVACTRARDHLVVSTFRTPRKNEPAPTSCSNAELIARQLERDDAPTCATPDQVDPDDPGPQLELPPEEPDARPELLDHDTWQRQRRELLTERSRPRSLAATAVHDALRDALFDPDDEVEAGVEKDPRDLDLPAWQKGRYGSAVGRAVHAVLQTIDLATGAGLEEAAAAQAAAEGILGREDVVSELARSALSAPSVRESLDGPRWRETYVAVPIGDTVLEGYIDLLYRGPDGLVVVDYKTASTAADLDRRVADYRAQGAAYAHAVETATGEPVVRAVFVFLTPSGVEERQIDDLDAAKAEVVTALGG